MILSVTNISKSFKKNQVLSDVSFELMPKTINCLLGVNGSGKSTLVNIITGLLSPSAGSITFGAGISKSAIGVSFQDTTIPANAKVIDIIKDQCGLYNVSVDDIWMKKLFEVFEIESYRNYKVRKLSGGTKRRVMLVMALIHKPKLVILDEPTADVDFILRRKIWNFLLEYRQNGATILFTTHVLTEAQQFAENIFLLNNKTFHQIKNKNKLLDGKKILQIKIHGETGDKLKEQLSFIVVYYDSPYQVSYIIDDLEMLSQVASSLNQLGSEIDYTVVDPSLEDLVFEEISK